MEQQWAAIERAHCPEKNCENLHPSPFFISSNPSFSFPLFLFPTLLLSSFIAFHHARRSFIPIILPSLSPNFDSFDQIRDTHPTKTLRNPSMTLGSGGSSVVGQCPSLIPLLPSLRCRFIFSLFFKER